jgi:PhnB protein
MEEILMAVNPIPKGYKGVTPYLMVKDAARALQFYRDAFGATEVMRIDGPDGKVGHAEIRLGGGHLMLAEERPDMAGPDKFGGSPVSLLIYVPDVDNVYPRAIKAGGTELHPLADQFYGDRSGTLRDPFGHTWTVATHIEDMSPEEMKRRAAKSMKAMEG